MRALNTDAERVGVKARHTDTQVHRPGPFDICSLVRSTGHEHAVVVVPGARLVLHAHVSCAEIACYTHTVVDPTGDVCPVRQAVLGTWYTVPPRTVVAGVTHTTFQELLLTPFNVHEILGFEILSPEKNLCQ